MKFINTSLSAAVLSAALCSFGAYAESLIEKYEKNCILGNDISACSDAALMYVDGSSVEQNDVRASELFYHGCEMGDTFSCSALSFSLEPTVKEHNVYFKQARGADTRFIPFSTFASAPKACLVYLNQDRSVSSAFKVTGILYNSSDLTKFNKARRITDDSDYYIVKLRQGGRMMLRFDDVGKQLPEYFIHAYDQRGRSYLLKSGWKKCSREDARSQ